MQSKPTQICNLLRKQIQDDNKTNCASKDSIYLNERERERDYGWVREASTWNVQWSWKCI